ncbi:hypothetical protein [Cupriavidus basilensis]|uniref:hypothetical protein n=1 Tax=Cupriavidus basilensis TaxID=68895 RepID=UPI0011863069|nr:hypothetical protein [Cupriavidus basilensis]
MASPKRVDAWRQIAETDFDSAFHLLLGRLVHAIARLDFNIGLQLRYWGHEQDAKIRELLEPHTAKLKGRLKALERLMWAAWTSSDLEGEREFALWFERAHRARGFRNDYSHGRWGVPGKHLRTESGRLCDATPLLVFVPLDWDMSPNRVDKSIDLTLEDFAAQVEEAELLSSQYLNLVTKYGAHLHIGQRLGGKGSI